VCAPGFTGSKEDFLALMPELTSYGWSVVAFDHRGQFESGRRPDYSLDGWADDVCRLAGHLPGPVHLVGHSLGGLIAGRAAKGRDWESVTLLNSGSGPIHQSQHDRLRVLIHALDRLTMEQIWQAKTASDRASGVPANEPEIEEFLQRRFLSTDPRSLSTMARILLDGPQQNLAGTTAQLLIAFGTEDPDSWSWQTQVDLAQRWHTRLATIPGAAHSPAVEAPEVTAALLAGTFTRAGDPRCVKSPGYGYAPGMRIMTPLDRDPASVRRARKVVGDQLCAWGLQGIVDDAELVTSELVTNAISHGGGFVELRISVLPDRVRISVLDGGRAGIPEVAGDRGLRIGGRGLSLVEHVASAWGYDITDDGKEVWAELAI
jgi:pimeloyl-ACP methyl ester carboxylesterase/anti-sigma regulatory factor (Ser/Thr protein kinase)